MDIPVYTPHPKEQCLPALVIQTTHGDHVVHTYKTEAERDKGLDDFRSDPRRKQHTKRVETCRARKLGWATPNRGAINTGCKAFDRQFPGITLGACIGNTYLSLPVRGGLVEESNGHAFPQGKLQAYDLDGFCSELQIDVAKEWVRRANANSTESLILVAVYHTGKRDRKTTFSTHGALVVGRDHRLIRRFDRSDLGLDERGQSRGVLDAVQPFFTDEHLFDRQEVWASA